MVMIKYLDKGPFYYHRHERVMPYMKDVDGYVMTDDYGNPVREPREELPYDPVYIMTDEDWMMKLIFKFNKEYPELCDIHNDDKHLLLCSVAKDFIHFGL